LAVALRSLKEEIRSCRADNEKIILAQEKQVEVNAIILQICQIYSDRDHVGSTMRRRIKLMGHMVVNRMVVTDQIVMTQ